MGEITHRQDLSKNRLDGSAPFWLIWRIARHHNQRGAIASQSAEILAITQDSASDATIAVRDDRYRG
ncbi:MAG: hypothetical protein RLZZ135_2668 [Cyanobacteriota bacterium]